MDITLAILLYPGLALALALGALLGILTAQRSGFGSRGSMPFSAEVVSGGISILLSGLALTQLPWPLHPAGDRLASSLLLLWALLEGAFLIPMLPGLLSPAPLAARAASREAQLSAAGRAVVWLAIGLALWQRDAWTGVTLPGHALLLAGGLLAFPAAAGLGPFAPEQSLSKSDAHEGLDDSSAGLLRFTRMVCSAALLAALIIAALPLAQIQPPVALALALAIFIVVGLLLRRVNEELPRFTLPGALRWCWSWSLPFALLGIVYLSIVH